MTSSIYSHYSLRSLRSLRFSPLFSDTPKEETKSHGSFGRISESGWTVLVGISHTYLSFVVHIFPSFLINKKDKIKVSYFQTYLNFWRQNRQQTL